MEENISHVLGLTRAMIDPDRWVCRIKYIDSKLNVTERTISPISWQGDDVVLALCFAREEPRSFNLGQIMGLELVPAHEAMMPEEIKEL